MTEPDNSTLNNVYTSYSGYKFNANSSHWKLSRDCTINILWIDDYLTGEAKDGAIKTLIYYSTKYAGGTTRSVSYYLKLFSIFCSRNIKKLDLISTESLISYRSTLTRYHEYRLGALSSFFRKWYELGYPGIDNEVPSLLKGWTLKGTVKGLAIQTRDPLKGALSDLEYESLYQTILDRYEKNEILLSDYVMTLLFMVTGRRPVQLADLKGKDLIDVQSTNGLREFVLNIPRRKQRGQFRSEFKPVALTPEVGLALSMHISNNEENIRNIWSKIAFDELKNLPIFPDFKKIVNFNSQRVGSFCEFLDSDIFHSTTKCLGIRLESLVTSLAVPSERTGENLRLFPTRLRRTLATRAAREGFGSLVIAELLDHTDDQNARVYTENVPEHVDAINAAVARQLAPLAQAFAGVLVDCEQDAVRGDDLNSRVRLDGGKAAGTCGHHGFCGALAPIACYTCRSFQPWLEGPHEDVLRGLLAERDHVLAITSDLAMASVNDRTIYAVAEVIRRCEARQEELAKHG